MPVPWMGIQAGVQVAGAISGFSSGRKAAKKAKGISKANQALFNLTSKQNLEQMQKRADQVLGEGKGRAYASNLMMTGSTKSYLNELESELSKEISHQKMVDKAQRYIIRKGGQAAASQASSMGWQSLLGGISNAAGAIGNI